MPIDANELLVIKKRQYQEIRENMYQRCGNQTFHNASLYPRLHLLMMEIEYLEKRPDASHDEIAFMCADLED